MSEQTVDSVLADLNGDILLVRSEHERARCVAIAREGYGERPGCLAPYADAAIITPHQSVQFRIVRMEPPEFRQCDPAYRNKPYSPHSSLTFCQAGCLVCSLASLAAWAGYDVDPVTFAERIAEAGAFTGGLLQHPSRVTDAFLALRWHHNPAFHSPRHDRDESSFINWRDRPADLHLLRDLLHVHPVVVEVDYRPPTPQVDQHFVLAYEYVPDPSGGLNDDLLVMDPMTGYTSVLTYFNPDWLNDWMERNDVTKVARTLTGARVWTIVFDGYERYF